MRWSDNDRRVPWITRRSFGIYPLSLCCLPVLTYVAERAFVRVTRGDYDIIWVWQSKGTYSMSTGTSERRILRSAMRSETPEFFTFCMTDAHCVHNALPDLQIEHERCDFLRIHKLAFFPTAARLKAGGVRVAMVARTKAQNGGYTYRIDGYSYDEQECAGRLRTSWQSSSS